MKRYVLFLALCASLYATETTTVESNDAIYDGNQILLSGQVIIENMMGHVHAEQAILKRDLTGTSKNDFPWAELSEHVVAHLSDGGLFECEKVIFDYQNLK